ncbi:MAG TPA: hypothetical protein VKR58_11985, partial [Aquella sp.]|nr:hypothetical protein [Aquella sp.]
MHNKLMILMISLVVSGTVYAVQDIQIVGGTNAGNPKVAIVNFTGDSENDETNISHTIANDLTITGEFTVKQYPDATNIEPDTKYIISGVVNGNNINFKLTGNELANKGDLLNQNISYQADVRKAAHTISNNAYQKITNVKGIFTSKIAYIVQNGGTYRVVISDYDGYNQKSIFSDSHPVTSLAWDNSGKLLSYVSFETGKPVVYVQNLYQARRYVVANFDGSNSSPAFTPDGR